MTAPPDFPRRLLRAEQVLAARTRRVAVVLEGSQDPHNVHAVLRTAEALGVQDVHLVAPRGEAATISPGVTQRAHEWLTVTRHADIDAAAVHCRAEGRELWGTANAADALPLTGLSPQGPIAIVLGNETAGLSDRALDLCDRVVRIDLVGFSGSLNLSVSAGLILWELRRIAVAGLSGGDLPLQDRDELRARWYPALLARPAGDPAVEDCLARAEEIRDAALRAPRVMPIDREKSGP